MYMYTFFFSFLSTNLYFFAYFPRMKRKAFIFVISFLWSILVFDSISGFSIHSVTLAYVLRNGWYLTFQCFLFKQTCNMSRCLPMKPLCSKNKPWITRLYCTIPRNNQMKIYSVNCWNKWCAILIIAWIQSANIYIYIDRAHLIYNYPKFHYKVSISANYQKWILL